MISLRSARANLTMLQTTGLFEFPVIDFDLSVFADQLSHLITSRLFEINVIVARCGHF